MALEMVTIRLGEQVLAELDDEAAEYGRTRSAHIREVLRTRNDHDNRGAEYEDRIENLEAGNERLRRQLVATNQRVEEHTDLVQYVEDELSYREASLGTRVKWWLFGKDD